MKYKKLFFLCNTAVTLALCASCSLTTENFGTYSEYTSTDISSVSKQTTQISTIGYFKTMPLKIKTTITDNSTNPITQAIIELYIDGDGDGKGLLGVGDKVFEVLCVNNELYIILSTNDIIKLTDVNARGYFSSLMFNDISDMIGIGFEFSQDFPVSFSGKQSTLEINSIYAQSSKEFDTQRVSTSNNMTASELIKHVLLQTSTTQSDDAEQSSVSDSNEVESFYTKSMYGVNIDGVIYSVGDTCNPSDYFAGLVPSGILTSNSYKEDERVDFLHISYTSQTGKTTFTTTSNYVQAIMSNADFNFKGFYKGMTANEVKIGLAYKLSAKDSELYKPFDANIVVTQFKNNVYYCSVSDFKFELRLSGGVLSEIYIEKPLTFM